MRPTIGGMAIVVGSIVAVQNQSSLLDYGAVSMMTQPPMFGKVETFADPSADVLWGDGKKTDGIDVTETIDEIVDASPTTVALIGQRVRVPGQNAALDIIVTSAYNRIADGAETGIDVVLGQTQLGAWRELLATSVETIP